MSAEPLSELSLAQYRCAACLYVSEDWRHQCPSCATFGRFISFIPPPEARHARQRERTHEREETSAPRVLRPPQKMIGKDDSKDPIVIGKTPSSRDLEDEFQSSHKALKSRAKAIGKVAVEEVQRVCTGIEPLDLVLGGGAVVGTTIMVGGAPGVGKSTLLAQALAALSLDGPALYACGEEEPAKVAERCKRLGLLKSKTVAKNLFTHPGNQWEEFLASVDKINPMTIVLDSVQVFVSDECNGNPGSDPQVKYITQQLVELGKETEAVVFMICHETKNKKFAGPRTIEHLVDVSLMMTHHESRAGVVILEPLKNRHGSIVERGMFTMGEMGLIAIDMDEEVDARKPKPHRVATKTVKPMLKKKK